MTSKPSKSLVEEWEIEKVSPLEAKKQIKHAFKAREPIILLGETGQGKTAIVKQAAIELGEELEQGGLSLVAPLDISDPKLEKWYHTIYETHDKSQKMPFLHKVTEPASKDAFDFAGLPGVREDGGQFYHRPDEIPDNPYQLGIWQLTEFNRPAGKRTIRPLLNAIERRVIGEHMIPPGISFVLDMNEGDLYDVEDVKDPYFIRRASWMWVENSLDDWLVWMEANYTSDLVRGFLLNNPTFFDSHARRCARKPYACGAVWTRIQRILDTLLPTGTDIMEIHPLLAGKVGRPYATALCEFVRRGSELSPTKLLLDYPSVREIVRGLVEQGKGLDRLASAALASVRFLLKQDVKATSVDRMIGNFVDLFGDLPLDTAQNVGMEFAEDQLPGAGNQKADARAMRLVIISRIMRDPQAQARLAKLHLLTSSTGGGVLGLGV